LEKEQEKRRRDQVSILFFILIYCDSPGWDIKSLSDTTYVL
jgi:hypothetical protein